MDQTMACAARVLYGDEEILGAVLECAPGVVAVDAPLALPAGRNSLEDKNGIHLRECDRELLRRKIRFFPLTLGPMRLLTERGMRLKGALEKEGLTVVETYPGAAQDILCIPRKGRGLELLAHGLRQAGVKGLERPMTADELDAVTCAMAGIAYLRGEHQALGDHQEILMVLPARPAPKGA